MRGVEGYIVTGSKLVEIGELLKMLPVVPYWAFRYNFQVILCEL